MRQDGSDLFRKIHTRSRSTQAYCVDAFWVMFEDLLYVISYNIIITVVVVFTTY